MTRYLLGQLAAAERDACEQVWFTDKAQFVQLCEAETALIDAYVRGDLRGAERTLFEQQFLPIPARRERINAARALLQLIDQSAVQPESWWQRWRAVLRVPKLVPALAMMAVVLLLAGGLWWMWRSRPNREEMAQPTPSTVEPAHPMPEPTQLAQVSVTPAPTLSPVPVAPNTKVFALGMGVLRSEGNEVRTLPLTRDVAQVRFQLTLPPNDFRIFAAHLRTAEGSEIERWNRLPAQAHRLTVTLAAQRLTPGDYVMVIEGGQANEELQRLPFKVTRER